MSAGMWAFIGVTVGGILTIVGQATAELLKSRVASRDRQDRRTQLARQFQRETAIGLQSALAEYRAALRRFGVEVDPPAAADERLAAARVGYQMLLHRVSSEPARAAVQAWETAALDWFQSDDAGTAASEAETWLKAMRLLGSAIRATE